MSKLPLDGLAATAQFTAAARARESARPDALFVDPWAARLAGPESFAWLDRLPPAAALWPVVRTRFLDDWLRGLHTESAPRQVVIVAAGLDARAFRLDWPGGTRIFEVDRPDVLTFKNETLDLAGATPCALRCTVGANLLESWDTPLIACGFSAQAPAIWIVEGLLMYLDPSEACRLMETIARLAAPGSWLGCDLPLKSLRGHIVRGPAGWLRSVGWDSTVATLADVARSLGRWPSRSPQSTTMAESTVFLLTATRAED